MDKLSDKLDQTRIDMKWRINRIRDLSASMCIDTAYFIPPGKDYSLIGGLPHTLNLLRGFFELELELKALVVLIEELYP